MANETPKASRAERCPSKEAGTDPEPVADAQAADSLSEVPHKEIMEALKRMDEKSKHASGDSLAEKYRREAEESSALKREMRTLYEAITETKKEIAGEVSGTSRSYAWPARSPSCS